MFTDVIGCSLDVLLMFEGSSHDFSICFQDVLMMSDAIVFQMEILSLMIQKNLMIAKSLIV